MQSLLPSHLSAGTGTWSSSPPHFCPGPLSPSCGHRSIASWHLGVENDFHWLSYYSVPHTAPQAKEKMGARQAMGAGMSSRDLRPNRKLLLLSFKSSLYVFDTSLLSGVCLAEIFLPGCGLSWHSLYRADISYFNEVVFFCFFPQG